MNTAAVSQYADDPRIAALYESERERAKARRQFGIGSLGGLALTLIANLLAPWVQSVAARNIAAYNHVTDSTAGAGKNFFERLLTIPDLPAPTGLGIVLTLCVFALPPLMAAWSMHAATTGWKHRPLSENGKRAAVAGMVMAAVITLIAVVGSYAHVRTVLIAGGMEPVLATIIAVVIDGALAMSSLLWLAYRPSSDAELRAAVEQIEREIHAERVNEWLTAERAWKDDQARAWDAWLTAERAWMREQQEQHGARVRLWLDAERAWKEQQRADHAERVRIWLDAEERAVRAWLDAERAWKEQQGAHEHAPDARDAHEHPARPERAEGDDPYARAKNLDTYAPPAHLRALAEELIARGKTRVSDAHAVAVALMLTDEGKPRAAIEHETGIQRDAIRRLIDSAAKLSDELTPNGNESAA
ncbi:hypothetical protein ABQE48_13105 [Mycolicibacterium thermoresistibile]